MVSEEFFENQDERSLAKTEIVAKYFRAWARIVIGPARNRNQNIAFVDLFSGPGRFEDGSYSTPLRILDESVSDVELCERLETRFNDKDSRSIARLRQEIRAFPKVERLNHPPVITNIEVTRDLVPTIERAGQIPTLFFVDPWGYKGLSLDLLGSAIRGWGCDLIFFFNYNRINPGINNERVDELIDDLFGSSRALELRAKLVGIGGHDREMIILNEMTEAIRDVGGTFVLPFTFRTRDGARTSHYLIFVTKEFLGFHLMKEVMAKIGSNDDDSMVRFEFTPKSSIQLGFLDEFFAGQRIEKLENRLLTYFSERSLTVEALYREHEISRNGTAFTKSDYKEAIRRLEFNSQVELDPPRDKRRMYKGVVTVPDKTRVTFRKLGVGSH